MIDDTTPPLGETWRDRVTALVKGGVGMVPLAGSMLAEVVGLLIRNQRLDRLESYCRQLNERFGALTEDKLRERFADPERVDLFEEGAYQSARALSEERRRYIANVVANGITGDDQKRIESKRILKLLGEIEDDQIVILVSHLHRHHSDHAFRERHAAILEPVVAHMQSTPEELNVATVHELSRANLVRLGLLAPKFQVLKKGEIPEFDSKTGMMKANYRKLTPLGRLLLVQIGLAEPGEF